MKELMPRIKDTLYPKKNELRKRDAVRAILLNDKNEIGLLHILGSDMFGPRDHFETPGGGVENDEFEIDALKREISEETGYTIEVMDYVGTIEIEYNLLNRYDVENYYIAKIINHHESHLLEYEKALFDKLIFIKMSDIESTYQNYRVEGVGKLIHERDLCAIKEAIKILKEEKK